MQHPLRNEIPGNQEAASARIIPIHRPTAQLNEEFEQQLQSIRALIGRLHPNARKRYFDAFLDHLLTLDVLYPFTEESSGTPRTNGQPLSVEQHCLIKELSGHLESLRNEAGDQ